jgi:L-alanine-DL-glutamate epimerase-like enolase superfamily enzyme
MKIKVTQVSNDYRDVVLTRPFKFGDVEVRRAQEAYCTLQITTPSGTAFGRSAQLMVPRWFDKRASQTSDDTVQSLRRSFETACRQLVGQSGTAFELTADLRGYLSTEMPKGTPLLSSGFGAALIEMALIDAVCNLAQVPFFKAVQQDLFGGSAEPFAGLTATEMQAELSQITPLWDVAMRHTVGYLDSLTNEDAALRPPEENSVSLDQILKNTGTRALKIKLSGNVSKDIERLHKLAPLYDAGRVDFATLDANEQYEPDTLPDLARALRQDTKLERLTAAMAYIEQPFKRETFEDLDVSTLSEGIPLMLDEADGFDEAFYEASQRGWSGVSVKSCKGVFRALRNYCFISKLNSEGRDAFLSGEDLTCQPGLCLQQDILMASAVGVKHAERNGHHFAGGMQSATAAEKDAFVRKHSDLYVEREGRIELNIRDGRLSFASLQQTGFGSAILGSVEA